MTMAKRNQTEKTAKGSGADSPKPSKRLRPVRMRVALNRYAEGSALIHMGHTVVMCTATVEDRVPDWIRGSGRGWVTAEYGMLPRSTSTRMRRERDKASARSLEISRLIGRSLRAAVDLTMLADLSITVDCDVIQADGGTRTAAINGGMLALTQCLAALRAQGRIAGDPVVSRVGAVSVGLVGGAPSLDLDYERDSGADVDMNVVMNAKGELVEIQASAEGSPFAKRQFDDLLALASSGIKKLIALQRKTIASPHGAAEA